MTSSFDDRQKAFENKFKMDEEFRFRVNARAVRLFGMWVAKQLGMSGKEAEAYSEEVVDADFDEPGIQDVLRKVQADFKAKGMDMTAHHLENEFKPFLEQAKRELG